MALCYNRLWKLLIDRGMTRTQMRLAAGISTSTLAKLSKGEDVNTSILVKICNALQCNIGDMADYMPDESTASHSYDARAFVTVSSAKNAKKRKD